MKKRLISAVILLLAVSIVFSSCSKVPEDVDKKIDEVIAQTLIKKNSHKSKFGECTTEGHIVLGYEKSNKGYTVYTIARSGMYGFENGNFVMISGSLVLPAVIELTNKLEFRRITYAQEGAMYDTTVAELFPEEYHERLKIISFEDENNINAQQDAYAKKYLDSIGREAKIGRIKDFEDSYPSMSDYAIVASVSNKLYESKQIEDYPYWYGNKEAIEDGIRVVYTTDFQMTKSRIKYTKTVYDTGEILESYYYSTDTGEELK